MTEIRQSSSSHLRFSHAPEDIMKRCFDNAAPGAIKNRPFRGGFAAGFAVSR
jgi:hypothetical protein